MNKEINEQDRIIIGVREWAVQEVIKDGLEMDKWLSYERRGNPIDAVYVCEVAQKLEGYVLRDIISKPFQPCTEEKD